MTVVALVLGAGRGERLGAGAPKGLVEVRGRTLVEWSARALARAERVRCVQPVLPAERLDALDAIRPAWCEPASLAPCVAGGETRQRSVALGLVAARRALPALEWVLVHDAARCLVTPRDAEQVLEAAHATGAALPLAPIADTVKRVRAERVAETLDRTELGLALTPQAFRVEILSEALEKAEREGFAGTDCASLVERLGVEVRVCAGRAENFKVTRPEDLERAAAILATRECG